MIYISSVGLYHVRHPTICAHIRHIQGQFWHDGANEIPQFWGQFSICASCVHILFSFFRAIGTYPYVFGAHKNFWSDVWYKRYRISNVSNVRNFCVGNFGRVSLEKLNIFGQKFRPTWNISQIPIPEFKINFGFAAHI